MTFPVTLYQTLLNSGYVPPGGFGGTDTMANRLGYGSILTSIGNPKFVMSLISDNAGGRTIGDDRYGESGVATIMFKVVNNSALKADAIVESLKEYIIKEKIFYEMTYNAETYVVHSRPNVLGSNPAGKGELTSYESIFTLQFEYQKTT